MKFESAVLQNNIEIAWFIDILKRENVRSYLEIGSKFGGSLWRVANSLPNGSRIVAVDLPQGDGSFKESQPHLEHCRDELAQRGYDMHLILADSTAPQCVSSVKALAPFDAVFIDGGHDLETIESDWDNYGPLGRIVAFHDINWKQRPTKKTPIEVPEFWNEIKVRFRHEEIKLEPRDNGIGVLWRS